ncbi:MFS transporter [Bordetella bronchiseptica]|uniref:Membrane protein n=1 Tax=Bordetella bronchiseptica (strain ATCC BAA-588 / NCTC 13252 / RB50) TaxID=257310 RepID=A0A0H3LVV4_BORBR|nr:MFS transporter [Bordetella bronchiseptica]AMG88893.2 MFS transporter [Bordetella bronchiseptica]CAE33152.1 putative membrane protein [Bordetella bronchiseptica RB50]
MLHQEERRRIRFYPRALDRVGAAREGTRHPTASRRAFLAPMLQAPASAPEDLPRASAEAAPPPSHPGVLAPFGYPAFRMIWIANLFANLGIWAQSVAAAWIVTEAQSGPLIVAMIQVAAALPLVALSIVTGVVADNHDRRKVMLVGMGLELVVGTLITALAFLGLLHPVSLIVAVFVVSIGSAIVTPAWQAAVSEQVPRQYVGNAVLLNSVNYNVARAIGPAIGGVLLGALGAPWVFLLNCFCYGALIWAIWRWRRETPPRTLPPERIYEGVVAALRFTEYSNVTRLVMMRAFSFGLSASALWALLPVLAHEHDNGSASLYGYMLGALGLGAIAGSLGIRAVQRRLGVSRLISVAAALLALGLIALGVTENLWVVFPALLLSGSCWIAVLATYNATVQLLVPDWVKARALALYQTAIFGGLALGSFIWGHFAGSMGTRGAMAAAGVALLFTVALLYRSRLPDHVDDKCLSVLPRAALPAGQSDFDARHGVVLVSIEYRIAAERARAFIDAAGPLRLMRMRNGADQWQLFRDLEDAERWSEMFVVDSWLQYLRMNDRMTLADKMAIDAAQAFHSGPNPPQVTHAVSYISVSAAGGRGHAAPPAPAGPAQAAMGPVTAD